VVLLDWRQAVAPNLWGLVWEGRPGAGAQGDSPARDLPDLEPLGQVGDSFIVARGADGVYIIDQHAAHERVCYEHLLERWGQAGEPPEPGRAADATAAQVLAVPEVLDLTPAEAESLERSLDFLASVGLEVEPFGGRAVVVRSVPAALTGVPAGRLVLDYLDRLGEEGEGQAFDRLRAARVMAACKAAMKAGQKLGPDEMEALIEDLRRSAEPRTCPHGRPTVLRVGLEQLWREFGR
jgi:DNA mismatch repair protein MutL